MLAEPTYVGPHATPTPLPLRIDPRPGECWVGYTERVAAFYDVRWHDLMYPVGPTASAAEYTTTYVQQRTWQNAGLGLTYVSAAAIGRYFQLTAAEVIAMQIAVFQGSALMGGARLLGAMDFHLEHRPGNPWHSLGMVWPRRNAPVCTACLAEDPSHRPLTWRLRWHAVCLRHRTPIRTPAAEDQPPESVPEVTVAAQEQILSRLTPDAANRAFFTELQEVTFEQFRADGIVAKNKVVYARHLRADTLIPRLAQLVHQATAKVDTVSEPVASDPQNQIDEKLPMDLYVPDLADLSYPLDLDTGRRAAAAAVRLGRRTTGVGSSSALMPAGMRELATLLARLEREGRSERYWRAIAAARRIAATARDESTTSRAG